MQVTIAVGGVREVCLGTQDDADFLYLKKRFVSMQTIICSCARKLETAYHY